MRFLVTIVTSKQLISPQFWFQLKMSELPVEVRFKTNLCLVFDVVSDIVALLDANGISSPVSSLVLTFGKSYIEGMDPCNLIDRFISKTSGHWELIRLQDPVFLTHHITCVFADNAAFAQHMQSINDLFKMIVDKPSPDIDDKLAEIWMLSAACVKQCIRYIDQSRAPELVVAKSEDGETVKRSYTKHYHPELSVKKLAELWDLKF